MILASPPESGRSLLDYLPDWYVPAFVVSFDDRHHVAIPPPESRPCFDGLFDGAVCAGGVDGEDVFLSVLTDDLHVAACHATQNSIFAFYSPACHRAYRRTVSHFATWGPQPALDGSLHRYQ